MKMQTNSGTSIIVFFNNKVAAHINFKTVHLGCPSVQGVIYSTSRVIESKDAVEHRSLAELYLPLYNLSY